MRRRTLRSSSGGLLSDVAAWARRRVLAVERRGKVYASIPALPADVDNALAIAFGADAPDRSPVVRVPGGDVAGAVTGVAVFARGFHRVCPLWWGGGAVARPGS